MKKVVFFGKTSLGKRLKVMMERDSNMIVESFCVTADYYSEGETFCGRPVVCFDDLIELYGKNNFEVYMTVRFGKMNQNRAQAFELCEQRGYFIANYIHPSSNNYSSKMGRGNIIFPNVYIADYSEIGNGNVITFNSLISYDSVIGDFNWLVNINLAGHTTIGNHCFMGISSGTNHSISIGNNNLISAGIIISKSTKDNTVILPNKNIVLKNIDVDIMDALLRKAFLIQQM
jgi:acetyltransferase-like isoleucine patch superfamily enzyme